LILQKLNEVRKKSRMKSCLKTKAVLVGEPTGGKPNHFGEIKTLKLPNTHRVVTCSTKYFTHAPEDTPSLVPDILVEFSFQDYLEKRDPFLQAVLSKSLN